jgi:hypothetical protein
LEKDTIKLGDLLFVGGTLWTDFNGEDGNTMINAARRMNDYNGVENSHRMSQYNSYVPNPAGGEPIKQVKQRPSVFTPQDALDDHKAMLKFISDTCAADRQQQVVVVGHHTPSSMSSHPRYRSQYHMNGCYHSNLDDFILDNHNIVLWTHGHTHDSYDYMIGSTRVVCNPRGYSGYESSADVFQLKYVDV